MKEAPSPPYSLEWAPSVFSFRRCEKNLMGRRAEHFSELLVRVQVILRAIPGETLIEVFSSA
jgi:hypothetical protein